MVNFFGGVGNETGGKVKFDYAGNICFAGTTESYNLIASVGAFKTINSGGNKRCIYCLNLILMATDYGQHSMVVTPTIRAMIFQ